MFRILERYLVSERLKEGFIVGGIVDVDTFMKFSLSVHNRRKSRMGLALKNHIEAVLIATNISYTRTGITEHKSKPDIIFPNIASYRCNRFDEANLTLQPSISVNQTNKMIKKDLQLVIPMVLHQTYISTQRSWLYTFDTLLGK